MNTEQSLRLNALDLAIKIAPPGGDVVETAAKFADFLRREAPSPVLTKEQSDTSLVCTLEEISRYQERTFLRVELMHKGVVHVSETELSLENALEPYEMVAKRYAEPAIACCQNLLRQNQLRNGGAE